MPMRLGTVLAALLLILASHPRATDAEPGDDQFAVAASHYANQRWELAASDFQALIDKHPQHLRSTEALFYSGEALIQLGRYDEAAGRFRTFLQQVPEHELAVQALFRQGEAHYLANEFLPAVAPFQRFLKQHGEHELAVFARPYLAGANLALAEKDVAANQTRLQEAERLYAQALEQSPAESLVQQCRFGLARARHLLEKRDKAAEGYADLLASPDTTIAVQSHYYLADIRASEQRPAEAAALYQALLDLDPQSRWAAAARGRVVLEHARAGDFAAARTAFQKWQTAVGQTSLDRTIINATAGLARSSGETEWPEQLYRLLADTASDATGRTRGLRELAATQLESGQLTTAVETLTALVKASDQDEVAAETTYLLAGTLQQLQRSDEALSKYLSIFRRWPESAYATRSIYRAALLLEARDQRAQAEELFERISKIPIGEHWQEQEASSALYHWAWVLKDLGRSDVSSEKFFQLHQRYPQSKYWSDATYRVAHHAMANGDYQRARSTLTALLADDRATELRAHALYLDARAAQASGGWEAMRKPLERLLAESPDSPLRMNAQYWLAESAYQLQQYDRAAQQFATLASQIEQLPAIWRWVVPLRQAQLLASDEQWDEARRIADEIVRQSPDFDQLDEVHYVLGRCHLASAEFDLAREAFRRAAPEDSAEKTEAAAMAQWMIGESFMHQEDYENAIPEYFRVETLYEFPKWQAAALLQAGKCYERTERAERAVKLYQKIQKDFSTTMFATEAAQRLQDLQTPAASSGT